MTDDRLSSWTIFDRPKDYPDGYIARRFQISSGRVIPTLDTMTGSLDEMRATFLARGLICFQRAKSDDAKIVETWM